MTGSEEDRQSVKKEPIKYEYMLKPKDTINTVDSIFLGDELSMRSKKIMNPNPSYHNPSEGGASSRGTDPENTFNDFLGDNRSVMSRKSFASKSKPHDMESNYNGTNMTISSVSPR